MDPEEKKIRVLPKKARAPLLAALENVKNAGVLEDYVLRKHGETYSLQKLVVKCRVNQSHRKYQGCYAAFPGRNWCCECEKNNSLEKLFSFVEKQEFKVDKAFPSEIQQFDCTVHEIKLAIDIVPYDNEPFSEKDLQKYKLAIKQGYKVICLNLRMMQIESFMRFIIAGLQNIRPFFVIRLRQATQLYQILEEEFDREKEKAEIKKMERTYLKASGLMIADLFMAHYEEGFTLYDLRTKQNCDHSTREKDILPLRSAQKGQRKNSKVKEYTLRDEEKEEITQEILDIL